MVLRRALNVGRLLRSTIQHCSSTSYSSCGHASGLGRRAPPRTSRMTSVSLWPVCVCVCVCVCVRVGKRICEKESVCGCLCQSANRCAKKRVESVLCHAHSAPIPGAVGKCSVNECVLVCLRWMRKSASRRAQSRLCVWKRIQ